MKPLETGAAMSPMTCFSALGRAVGDETEKPLPDLRHLTRVSVLSVEPWGMKRRRAPDLRCFSFCFSALGRAVGDETATVFGHYYKKRRFSALGRAVGDETTNAILSCIMIISFQCSRSSRGG